MSLFGNSNEAVELAAAKKEIEYLKRDLQTMDRIKQKNIQLQRDYQKVAMETKILKDKLDVAEETIKTCTNAEKRTTDLLNSRTIHFETEYAKLETEVHRLKAEAKTTTSKAPKLTEKIAKDYLANLEREHELARAEEEELKQKEELASKNRKDRIEGKPKFLKEFFVKRVMSIAFRENSSFDLVGEITSESTGESIEVIYDPNSEYAKRLRQICSCAPGKAYNFIVTDSNWEDKTITVEPFVSKPLKNLDDSNETFFDMMDGRTTFFASSVFCNRKLDWLFYRFGKFLTSRGWTYRINPNQYAEFEYNSENNKRIKHGNYDIALARIQRMIDGRVVKYTDIANCKKKPEINYDGRIIHMLKSRPTSKYFIVCDDEVLLEAYQEASSNKENIIITSAEFAMLF